MEAEESKKNERKKYGTYFYAPTAGVRADLKRLMNNFLSHNTVRYAKFSEIWRGMNMSYIWSCRSTDREAREVTNHLSLLINHP